MIDDYLKQAVERRASDVYLKPGCHPMVRIDGQLVPIGDGVLTAAAVEEAARSLMGEERLAQFQRSPELNFAFHRGKLGRFRANALLQRGQFMLVIRCVRQAVQSFEELHLPAKLLTDWATAPRGLVLITGTTGSGKSTTAAAILNYLNHHAAKHIVTVEDPIEFVVADVQSMITQREVGLDTNSFPEALRSVMRQAADVLYLSDIRDQPTMAQVLAAAETGHLVISCLHTINATNTLERMLNFFPPHNHNEIRLQLSLLLRGIISLRLLPRLDGQGRIPAYETLVVTPTIRELIREWKLHEISGFLQEGALYGMQTFTQSLVQLYESGLVGLEEVRRVADSRDELDVILRQVRTTSEAQRLRELGPEGLRK